MGFLALDGRKSSEPGTVRPVGGMCPEALGFCSNMLLQGYALHFWLEACISWSRHCLANKLRARFLTPQG